MSRALSRLGQRRGVRPHTKRSQECVPEIMAVCLIAAFTGRSHRIQIRMLQMEPRSILVSLSQSQNLRLPKRLPVNCQRGRRARILESMRNADGGITRDVGHVEMAARR